MSFLYYEYDIFSTYITESLRSLLPHIPKYILGLKLKENIGTSHDGALKTEVFKLAKKLLGVVLHDIRESNKEYYASRAFIHCAIVSRKI